MREYAKYIILKLVLSIMVWEEALEAIRPDIEEKGFFHWDKSFQDFKAEYGIDAQQKAPFYLSLDFWRLQRKELLQNNWYVIRFGRGSFGIFSEDQFPKPYLELNPDDFEEITCRPVTRFKNLRRAFKNLDWGLKAAENTLLELARFYGVYEVLTEFLDDTSEFQIGPRGGMTQSFDLFFKRRDDTVTRLGYNGQVELDYTIWTESRVLVFEAKSISRGGLDVGWHKLAYPAHRFYTQKINNGLKVNPVYFLRTIYEGVNTVLIFLFREIEFQDGGVILNDRGAWEPLKVFRVDIDALDRELREGIHL